MWPYFIAFLAVAAFPLALAGYGGHLAAIALEGSKRTRALVLVWSLAAAGVIAAGVQQIMAFRADEQNSINQAQLQSDMRVAKDEAKSAKEEAVSAKQETASLRSDLQRESGRREQAEIDLGKTVQKTGAETRNGVAEDIRKSPIKVEVSGNPTSEFKPQIEGLTFTTKTIPSPIPDRPFALEITIQSQTNIAPLSIGFTCDKPISGTHRIINGPLMESIYGQGPLIRRDKTEDPNTYGIKIGEGITPTTPWVVTLTSKEAFRLLGSIRLP